MKVLKEYDVCSKKIIYAEYTKDEKQYISQLKEELKKKRAAPDRVWRADRNVRTAI